MSVDRSQDSRLLARHLGAITRAVRIHDVSNRAVSRLIEWCARDLTTLFRSGTDARVEVDAAGVLVVNNTPLRMRREIRTQLLPFAAMLRDVGAGGFRITSDVEAKSILTFFRCLHELPKGTARAATQRMLDDGGGAALQLLAPRVLVSGMSGGPGSAVRMAAAESLQAYIRAILAVQSAREEGTLTRVPAPVFRAAQGLADLADGDLRMHVALASIKEDLDYQTRHPVHAMILAMALGARLGLPRVLLVELGLAAMLAASLPDNAGADEILEFTTSMLQSSRLSLSRARRMLAVFDHRAGVDRTGPPYIALESPPHLFSRVSAIAIAFDQLTTSGDGRPGLLADEALAQLGEPSTVRYDAELLRLFASVIGRYPLGSALLLDTGEVGVVVHTPSDPAMANRPLVRIVRDERGAIVSHGPLVDLADPACGRTVESAVDAEALGIDSRRAVFG